MATKSTKPTVRETSAYIREKKLRPLVVTVVGSVLLLRGKGLRRSETVDLASLYYQAVKARVAAERAAKKAMRKAKA